MSRTDPAFSAFKSSKHDKNYDLIVGLMGKGQPLILSRVRTKLRDWAV